jgi:hypothetical protein
VIPKAKAAQVQQEAHANAAAALEAKIDSAIEKNIDGSVYVDVGGVPRPALEAVMKKYRDGGWDVNYTASQRDGATLTLS